MLWYKAWLETRSRFLISLAGMAAFCSFIVHHGDRNALSYTGPAYYYLVLHSGHIALCTMWSLAVVLLMMGGLLREKAVGTAGFTLALPVSRTCLMGVRIGMGLMQAIALAVVPWGAMLVTAVLTGKVRSLGQPAFYLVLLMGGGLLFYGIALLVSSLVEGEYTAPVITFGAIVVTSILLGDDAWQRYSPLFFMNGALYLDRHTGMLTGPIPWMHAGVSLLITAALVAASVKAIQRREF